ncbi:hypothetical protein [Leucobacter sp. USHLN153]|uniref:hypothetical protein n=1 Tax=Leucobacter sp. USHLN153 TaxID=3081268 RepID=UPI003016F635
MTDDLSKVTDDAQLVWTDTAGTVPENKFYEDSGRLYWHGSLAVTPHLPFTGTDGLMRLLVLGGGVVVVLLVVARRLTKRAA